MISAKQMVSWAVVAVLMVCPLMSSAKVSCAKKGDIVVIDNFNSMFDYGMIKVSERAVKLLIPKASKVGLNSGGKVRLISIEFGHTPMQYNVRYADKIKVCSESGDFLSSVAGIDAQNVIWSADKKQKVSRLTYQFRRSPILNVGEKYDIEFCDKNGKPVDMIRYAVALVDDGKCVFENLNFVGKNRVSLYAPVCAIRLAPVSEKDLKEAMEAEGENNPEPQEEKKLDDNAVKSAKEEPKAPEPRKEQPTKRSSEPVQKEKEHSVSLSVDRPKRVEVRDLDEDRSYEGFWYKRKVEVKTCSYVYNGKLSCMASKKDNAEIKLEAYFVVREIGKGSKERIDGSLVVGEYEFGGSNPSSYAINFTSPKIDEVKERESYGSITRSDSTGTRYVGVIVRALENGKVRKVVSVPSNQKWNEIGKKEFVAFDETLQGSYNQSSRSSGFGSRVQREAYVYTRIEGTGKSTPPGWMDDFYAAQEIAKREGKLMLVVFCGSDWCGPCMRLNDTVLKTAKFQNAVKDRYVLVFIDSPQDKSQLSDVCRKQNPEISRMIRGYEGGVPSVNIVSADGVRLMNLGGAMHMEDGLSSYMKFFEGVDTGVEIMQTAKASVAGKDIRSPEYISAVHQALQKIDGEIMADYFMSDIEHVVNTDKNYLQYYPYIEFVRPLEVSFRKLLSEISDKATEAMKADGLDYSYSEHQKYLKKLFKDGEYRQKSNEMLGKIGELERKLSDPAAIAKLKDLRVAILARINN